MAGDKVEYVICTKGAHVVLRSSLIPYAYKSCCRECYVEYQKKFQQKARDLKKANRPKVEIPKTRVCKDCGKRKKIDKFYKQKPPRIPVFKPDYRWDCKKCQCAKSRKALLKKTNKKERAVLIRDYMRTRNNTLPSSYRVTA